MHKNEQLRLIVNYISRQRLGEAINAMEIYLSTRPTQIDLDKLTEIRNDYQLMADYWRRGFDDPQRPMLYRQLLHRLYQLVVNRDLHERFMESPYLQGVYKRPRIVRTEWAVASIKSDLEAYVSDSVLLELEPQHVQQKKRMELNTRHQQLVNDIFDYILTSHLWKDSLCDAFVDLLLAPTIDVNDQLMIISAISLSLQNAFDINKFKVLTTLYQQSSDNHVRQRALVGWVLAVDSSEAEIFPEVVEIVNTICQDDLNCKELTELQMQLYYCIDTDNDQKTIHDEIMPDLVNGSRIQMSQGGEFDMDEDSLEDILHPEALERDMEKMEKSMKRMADMRKQGADIYYSGFRQMKRFPFFQDISNWFAPFMPNHPAIAHSWEKAKGSKMLHYIADVGSFCDSDKYSLVLAFEQVRNQLPSKMIEMMDNGAATPMPVGGEVDPEEKKMPAYIRRIYLQDLYRFYNIFDKRFEFPNPFGKDRSLLFFTCSLFNTTPLKKHFQEVASFLIKRQHADDALRILEMIPQEQYNYQLYMMKGGICRQKKSLLTHAADCFRKALELNPDDERAMTGFARASFDLGCYAAAIENYEKLLQIQPEKKSYMLYLAYSLSNMYRYNEAEKYLYKLNYEYPDDLYVKRGLAEVLTGQDKYEQALSLYEQLLSGEQSQADDLKNYAFCLWFAKQNDEALKAFKKYVELRKTVGETTDFRELFLVEKAEMLRRHHISQMDVLLMLDAVNFL